MASSAKREGAEVETPKSSSPKLARNASSKSSKKGLLANGSAGVSSKTLAARQAVPRDEQPSASQPAAVGS